MIEDQGLTAEQFDALVEADDEQVGQLVAEYLDDSDGDVLSDAASGGFGWADITDFVDRHRQEFHQTICVDWNACAKLQYLDSAALQAALEQAIGPLLSQLTGAAGWIVRRSLPVLISLAAAYIVRQRLKTYCGCA
jgi:hypothetical protein